MRAGIGVWGAAMLASVTFGAASPCGAQVTAAAPRPATPEPKAYAFPPILSHTLSNGIPVAIVENHATPVVSVRLVIDSSSLVDPKDKTGLFSFMLSMLGKGTTSLTADQLADRFAELGNPVTSAGFTTVTRNLDASIALLADVVVHPSFPEADLALARATRIATILRLDHSASLIPQLVYQRIAYGAEHPYARRADSAGIARITREDVIAIHQSYVRPENMSLVVVGDVNPARLMPTLDRAFGGIPRGGKIVEHDVPPAKPPASRTIYLVDSPSDTNVYLYSGHVAPPQSSPEYAALDALTTLLGAQNTGKLWDVLRTDRGFAYQTGAGFLWEPAPEPSTLRTLGIVSPARADSAVIAWMDVLRGFVDHAPSPEEMTFVRSSRLGNVAIRLQTDEAMAGQIADLFAHKLPLDFMARYGEGMQRVTAADVLAAARKYLDPDHLVMIIVGPRAKIEAKLRAANIAPVIVVDRDGRPIQ